MSSDKEVDIFRDTPVRLLGYANEIGEAFRPLVKKIWVHASYGVAISYVAADTFDKAGKTYKNPFISDAVRRSEVLKVSADTLVWQGLASVIIPGFTINRVCAGTLYLLRKTTKWPKIVRKWTATGVGIFCIPLIVTPIDHGVHFLMDNSLRKWLGIPCYLDHEAEKK
ncbi:mitochondrial fission process protein 1 [Hetaerina americana]|uniref:mitochondrial fission process protein 1 n=1 Tax=Hetaerina americana TaxID=62018 RepID=UPI003A7F1408